MKRNTKPLREMIYNQLVEDIIIGRINEGEKLVEGELSKRFNVSRTPAREALFLLERDGYISLKKNVGAVVKKINEKKVEEIFEIVAQLEGFATERVVKKIKEKDILYLTKLQKRMELFAEQKRFIEYENANIQFHKFFIDNCNNPTLKKIVIDHRNKVYRLVKEGASLPKNIQRYIGSHRKIIKAISEKKALRAAMLMKEHVLESAKYLLDEMGHRDDITQISICINEMKFA